MLGFLRRWLRRPDPPAAPPPVPAPAPVPAPGLAPVPPKLRELLSLDPWGDVLRFVAGECPAGTRIDGHLTLAKLRVRALPAGLAVGGNLDLRQCQRLGRLGDGLDVAGDLRIGGRCAEAAWYEPHLANPARRGAAGEWLLARWSREGQAPLAALPAGLRVRGDLELRQCRQLARLPDDMVVGGSIRLEGCSSLASLPAGLAVAGDLAIVGAPRLRELPAGLRVGGSLRLSGAGLAELPAGLHVGGDLVLEFCARLAALPAGLRVGGSLTVRRCPIVALPDDLAVGRDLRLHRLDHLGRLPDGLAVPGRIELDRCPKVETIPAGLAAGTDLRLCRGVGLRALPAGLRVPGTLDLTGSTRLAALPAGLDLGAALDPAGFLPALRLADCPGVATLPDDLVARGPIEVAGSGLVDLPDRLIRSLTVLWRGARVPAEAVFRPGSLTPERILTEPNAELRRIMIERVGVDALLDRAGATVLDEDRDPGGPRRLVRVPIPPPWRWGRQDDARYFLQCRCPSTGREYLLRVPPDRATCHDAAAWLAGFDDPSGYRPLRET